MVKDTYWFQHDYNSRNDVKIQALMTDHGVSGYGFYFILLEVLREQSDYRLKLDKYTYETLATQSRSDKKTVRAILKDCMKKYIDAEGPLISTDGEYIWSEGLINRMKKLDESRAKRAAAGKKGMSSRWGKRGNSVITDDNITVQNSTVQNNTVQNSTEEYITEEYSTEQEIKKEYEKEKGGGSIGEAIVSDFFVQEALEPDAYFGANEETKSEADKLTCEIWKRFVPGGSPSDFDKRMVFREVIAADKDEKGEWRGYLSKEKTDVLLYAFKAAAKANKTGNWNYIESVLRRAGEEGLKTLKEIEDRDFEKGKL